MNDVYERLGWVRHQLDMLGAARLQSPLTHTQLRLYNELIEEEHALLDSIGPRRDPGSTLTFRRSSGAHG